MTVTCSTLAQFTACIADFVKRGLTFRADADTLVITLLGGF